jgi:hypothetical protein
MIRRARSVPGRSYSRMRAVPHASSTLVVKVLRSSGPAYGSDVLGGPPPALLDPPPFRSALHQYITTPTRLAPVYPPSERSCRPQHYTVPYPPQ